MAGAIPKNSVWSAMNYTPPRGRCNYKPSLMSPACSCNRFMLHPVKAATSFECDGCGHHASYHLLENAAEDAVLKKWAEQENQSITGAADDRRAIAGPSGKKRKLVTEKAATEGSAVVEINDDLGEPMWVGKSFPTRRPGAKGKDGQR